MKPYFFLLILLVFSCKQAATDSGQTTPPPTPETETTAPAGKADAVAKMVSGKKWQSKADPDITMEIRDGRMITMLRGAERSDSPFVTFSDECPGGKKAGEGMNAGFICCMTLATKIETHYLVLTADEETFEYIEHNSPDATPQVFTLFK